MYFAYPTKSDARALANQARELMLQPDQWRVDLQPVPGGYLSTITTSDKTVRVMLYERNGKTYYRAGLYIGNNEAGLNSWRLLFGSGKRHFRDPQKAVNALFTAAESRLLKVMDEYRRAKNLVFEGREQL